MSPDVAEQAPQRRGRHHKTLLEGQQGQATDDSRVTHHLRELHDARVLVVEGLSQPKRRLVKFAVQLVSIKASLTSVERLFR